MTFRPRAYERGGGLPVFPMIEVIHLALAGARPRDTRPGWSANKDSEFSSLRKEEYRRRTTVRSGSAAGRRQPRISDRYCSEPENPAGFTNFGEDCPATLFGCAHALLLS